MSIKIAKENLKSIEVKIGISDRPDLKVNLFELPEPFIVQEFLKIKDGLKIQKYVQHNKKAEKDLLMLDLFFFFQSRKKSILKSPKELNNMFHPDIGIRRYYSDEIEDRFFNTLKSIQKEKVIDKADFIAESWQGKTIPVIIGLFDDLDIKNLRRNGLTAEEIKDGFNKKNRDDILKILKEFIEEINSPETNIKLNDGDSEFLPREEKEKIYSEMCNKIWDKFYRRMGYRKIAQYIIFIKQEVEDIYIKYYLKIVKNYISLLRDYLSEEELRAFKMFYLPLNTLGNKILYLHHDKYFNSKDFDKSITPLLMANKVFDIRKVRSRNIKKVLNRSLRAFLSILYYRKFLLRGDEKDKQQIVRKRTKNKEVSLDDNKIDELTYKQWLGSKAEQEF